MGAARENPDWFVGSSTLKGPLLMLVLQRPGDNAHAIATRLIKRLGPTWGVEPADIYPMLKRLAKKGLLVERRELHPKRSGRDVKKPQREVLVYYPTELTATAAVEWLESPISREAEESELLALLAVAREQDAPTVLRGLEEFERDCFVKSRMIEQEIPTDTWGGLLLEASRKTVVGRLESDIDSAETTRALIKERMSDSP